MSADLFAEFGSTQDGSRQQQGSGSGIAPTRANPQSTFSFFDDLTGPAAATVPQTQAQPSFARFQSGNNAKNEAATVDDGDEWGDFEGGSSSFDAAPPVKQDPFTFPAPQTSQPPLPTLPSTRIQDDPFAFATTPPPQPDQSSWQKAPIIKAKKSADPSVLFDAEDDFGDDDDFGDFEEPGAEATFTAPAARAADLLGDLSLDQKAATISGKSGVTLNRNVDSSSRAKESSTASFGSVSKTQKPPTAPIPPAVKEDSWDTFEDWEASIPAAAPPKAASQVKASKANVAPQTATSPPPVLSPTFDDPNPGELPPTNVPPPAVLLTLFPPLFADAQEKLFKPMAAQTLPMRNKLLSEPATITYLQGYLMLASVAAHIIAGRKLRWKRDQHLSQGMRIGPASSRATSGMKLSTIDKSENMKEEREASDVVRAWKDQVGRLRHVVSAANQIKSGTLGAVPDIQETMPVKVLKQAEGGVPAPQPCMLCGLKRDERVGTADQEVEDSFGEWWVDQTNMHRGESWFPNIESPNRGRSLTVGLKQGAETSGVSTGTNSGSDETVARAKGMVMPRSTWVNCLEHVHPTPATAAIGLGSLMQPTTRRRDVEKMRCLSFLSCMGKAIKTRVSGRLGSDGPAGLSLCWLEGRSRYVVSGARSRLSAGAGFGPWGGDRLWGGDRMAAELAAGVIVRGDGEKGVGCGGMAPRCCAAG